MIMWGDQDEFTTQKSEITPPDTALAVRAITDPQPVCKATLVDVVVTTFKCGANNNNEWYMYIGDESRGTYWSSLPGRIWPVLTEDEELHRSVQIKFAAEPVNSYYHPLIAVPPTTDDHLIILRSPCGETSCNPHWFPTALHQMLNISREEAEAIVQAMKSEREEFTLYYEMNHIRTSK